ncbi:MAG: hypothetical protein JO369_02225 [Paucibacter sp.]|nr:hypothetical protein [Roseateles sp.]
MKFKSLLLCAALSTFALAALPAQARAVHQAGDPVAPAVVGVKHGAKQKQKPAKHGKHDKAAKHGKKPAKPAGKAKKAKHGKPAKHGKAAHAAAQQPH